MSEAGKNALPKLLDDPKAPEMYAAAATGFFNANGVISITLESPRADHSATSPGPINRVVVGRLVMPAAGAQALAVGLFEFLEKQGFNFKNNAPAVPAAPASPKKK